MPEDSGFLITLPMFLIWMPEGPSPYALRHPDGKMFLPVFTDADSVRTYRARSKISLMAITEFPTLKGLKKFLEGFKMKFDFVAFDPHPDAPNVVTLPYEDFLKTLDQ